MNHDNHETQNKKTITVLIVEPMKEPYVKEIDSSLESLQHEVGGDIEAVYPFKEEVALIANEDGKILGLPLNRALRDDYGQVYDIIAGTFLITGLTEDNFGSLDKECINKFSEHFRKTEQFFKFGNKIVIFQEEKNQHKQEHIKQKEENELDL